jgi:hypothetical protein
MNTFDLTQIKEFKGTLANAERMRFSVALMFIKVVLELADTLGVCQSKHITRRRRAGRA